MGAPVRGRETPRRSDFSPRSGGSRPGIGRLLPRAVTMRRAMSSPSAVRLRSALACLAFASGCAQPPAPAAPNESPDGLGATPESAPEVTAAESSPPEPIPAEPTPSDTAAASAPAASGPKDTRGKAEIQQVMAGSRDKVRACYDAALPQNPGAKGNLVIDFTIDPHGEVKQAEVNWSASELHIPELDTCAVDAVRSIKFPASSRGLESKVSYPFNFNPPRPGKPASREEPAGPSR
jgi:TonB family protein